MSLNYNELILDSQYATRGLNSQSSKDWPSYTFDNPLKRCALIKILEVQIPFSYYVINSTNNSFIYRDINGATNYTIILANGNYTGTTMAAELAAKLSAIHAFTVEFIFASQKFKFTSSIGNFSFIFGGIDDHGDVNPRIWLGFDAGESPPSQSNILYSTNAANVTGANYIYLNSSTIGPLCSIYSEENLGGLGSEVAQVAVTASPGGVIFWRDPSPDQWFDLQDLSTLQHLDFYCTLGGSLVPEPMSFNGQGFVVKVGVLTGSATSVDTLRAALPTGANKRVRPA